MTNTITKQEKIEKLNALATSPVVHSLVNSWLQAEAMYQTVREQANEVYRQVLSEIPLFNDRFERSAKLGERIYDVDQMYLSKNEEACSKVYFEATTRFVEMGLLKQADHVGTDPAYVYWDLRRQAEHELIRLFGVLEGITLERLLYKLDVYKKFIDLTIRFVVSHKSFKKEEL